MISTYEECLNYIHSRPRFKDHPGLEDITALLALAGNPQERLAIVHIAGTNGKGSVTTLCANTLIESGYRTGSFISPFIIDFRERIQINGQMIPQEDLIELVNRLIPLVEQVEQAGQAVCEFSFITAAALIYFERQNCDVVCMEVGLGGRFDATNIIPSPLVSVITSIGFDHEAVLGNTLEKIALEKCGIIKSRRPVVCYPEQRDEVLAVIMEQAAMQQSTLHLPFSSGAQIESDVLFDLRFTYDNLHISLALAGDHQFYNALTAIQALRVLQQQGYRIPDAAIESAFARTTFPARMERLSLNPLVILDGAHNPDGMAALEHSLQKIERRPLNILVGMLQDKDVVHSIEKIAKHCDKLIAVTPDNPRKMDCRKLQEIAAPFTETVAFDDHTAAIDYALQITPQDGALVVCGSLYLAADLRNPLTERVSNQ